ncbi:DUF4148 domain-containing protein [Allopusillimonas ginsengisoli]|uniref:DUF4148 domain-containing protein n=1 Tax=Allopusillimonas ginsengisoli TaxID=453575 RepID=UPI0039C2E1EA
MKTAIRSIILVSILAAGSAGATTADVSTTRAQVTAELQAAEQSGHILGGEASVYPVVPDGPDQTRAQVVAKLQAAEQSGHILGGEASVYPVIPDGPDKTRTQVATALHAYESNHSKFIAH